MKDHAKQYGPQDGSTIVLSAGRLHVQQDMLDAHPDATEVQGASTHQEFLRLVEKMSCMCCPIGRRCESNVPDTGGKKAVAFHGSSTAPVVIVGEAPGKNEWKAGIPFIGKSGNLLRDMLTQVGFVAGNIGFMNCVMCRPTDIVDGYAKDRAPTPNEVKACFGNLLKQLELVSPFIVIAVGRVPATHLFGMAPGASIEQMRGKPFVVRGLRWKRRNREVYHHPVGYVTYHPAACLGNRDTGGDKKMALRMDLEKVHTLFHNPKSLPYLDGSEKLFAPNSIVRIGSDEGYDPSDTTCH